MSRATRAAIARRLHAAELVALRELVERQHVEIESLRADLLRAEDAAESWRDDALRMMRDACADGSREPGITKAGELVTIPVDGERMRIEAEQANLRG